jgi:hypothetical protein
VQLSAPPVKSEQMKKRARPPQARNSVRFFEQLESRLAMAAIIDTASEAHPWHNVGNAYDVDGDGEVAPGDALTIINYLNTVGSGPVPETGPTVAPYLDTTADNQVAADDVMAVLNKLHYLNLIDKINGFQNWVVNELVTPLYGEGLRPVPVENGSETPGNSDNISYAEFILIVQSARKKVEDAQFGSISHEDAEQTVDELMSSVVVHREMIFVRRPTE